MDQKICLDTDVVIDIFKKSTRVEMFREKYQHYQPHITTITLFELFLRKTNLGEVEKFASDAIILPFDEFAAKIASSINKMLATKGINIPIRDLFIASICISQNCKLATFNKKHFVNIKELKLVE